MYTIVKVLLCTCVLVHLAHADFPLPTPNQQGLANLIFSSNDPQLAFACFSEYIAELNTTGVAYKQNYTNCLQEAKVNRQHVENGMSDNRVRIAKTTSDICDGWERCNRINATLDVFWCHAKEGPNKAKVAYEISDRAEEFAKLLSSQYRQIDTNQDLCFKAAERKYTAECSDLYHQLKVCLKGRKRPPPPPPPFRKEIDAINVTPTALTEPEPL